MIPRPAQYLLRFDDLCPTMSRERWNRFAALIEEFDLQPILAVIPENRDPELEIDPPDPNFWAWARAMEVAGAAIGLHGYRHQCVTSARSLVPLHRVTEFAGVPEATQREWIRAGLEILKQHGLTPRLFVAPRHGFDRATLRALRHEGIECISDGVARAPFLRDGMTWIPQQLWAPEFKASGLWTILVHANTATDAFVSELREFLRQNSSQFTSLERVVAEFGSSELGWTERLFEAKALLRLRGRHLAKRAFRRH